MTYLELINDFWLKNQSLVRPLSSTEIAFYFYMLKECCLQEWENPFILPTRKIVLELDFRKDTITNVRNSLQQKGFIKFKKGDRRTCDPQYSILDKNGVLVQITDQSAYQNSYQNSYQKPYQKTPPYNPPICTTENIKEIESKDSTKKLSYSIEERRGAFKDSVGPYIAKYGQDMIDKFTLYWTQLVSDDMMRFEQQDKFYLPGRLATWHRNNMSTETKVTDISEKEKKYQINWDKVKHWYVGLGLSMERWTEGRKMAYISLIDSYGDLELFKEAVKRFSAEVKASDWILGLAGSPMRTFEWLFTKDNFTRVIEGKYRENYNRKHEDNSTREKDRRGTLVDESFQNVDYSEAW